MEIGNKTVLITGASSGVGAEIAKAMAQAGAAVILLLARNEDALKEVASEVTVLGSTAYTFPVDLSDSAQTLATAHKILSDVGVPDIIVNNAGSGQWKFLEETSPQEIQAMMALPYFAAAWLTGAFLPAMRQRNSGHIVNISSVASRIVFPGATAYTAARWAMRGLTEALRADLHGSGIGVTLYESGEIESPYWLHNPGSRERIPTFGKLIPVLKPSDAARAIVVGVQHNKRLIVIPLILRVVYVLNYVFPRAIQWKMTQTGVKITATHKGDAK